MTSKTKKQLADFLRDLAEAHDRAVKDTDGDDPDWAIWYAEHAMKGITEQFGFNVTRAQMVECFQKAHLEHQARAPERDWAEFFAEMFLEHLAPASDEWQSDKLALYFTPYCPFCMMVLRALDGLDVLIDMRDVSANAQDRDDLISARGRATVPVLRITAADGSYDRWMPESRDIALYLQTTYG